MPDYDIRNLLHKHADEIVERIDDSGLLFNVIPIGPGAGNQCWRCIATGAAPETHNRLGLCEECYEWLHEDDNVATHVYRRWA